MYTNLASIDELLTETMRELNRAAIGFEPTLRRLKYTPNLVNGQNGYPPFNLEKLDEHNYRITLAVAGFGIDDIDITVADNTLTIAGNIKDKDDDRVFVHKGIAERSFTRSFVLADHVNVTTANMENGLLTVDLQHEIPEALKPRKIVIGSSKLIDAE